VGRGGSHKNKFKKGAQKKGGELIQSRKKGRVFGGEGVLKTRELIERWRGSIRERRELKMEGGILGRPES